MCGIVGAAAERNVEKILVEGLKRLEYRGYDSAGIALLQEANQPIHCLRTKGKVRELEKLLHQSPITGHTGIAHTRWATHGVPAERNAHPLLSHEKIALVHNGIIENHDQLRQFLFEKNYQFHSETDSETIVHLLHYHLQNKVDLLTAVKKTVAQLEGAFALGIIFSDYPNRFIGVRSGSPLVVGKGMDENFLASDPIALLSVTQEFIYLEEGDMADITPTQVQIYNSDGKKVERKICIVEATSDVVDRGEHRHYMSKEIAEQPTAVSANIEGRLGKDHVIDSIFGLSTSDLFKRVEHIQLVACGTSYHAAMVARYWMESLTGVSCSVEVASEFRYRKMTVPKNSLFVCLSQSGETADTLAALRLAKKMGYLSTLGICNVPESSLMREAELHFMTRAGVEIGVASTKAFSAQLVALLLLTLSVGHHHPLFSEIEKELVQELKNLPRLMETVLELNPSIAHLAKNFLHKEHALFLGRGALYPIALEGALKLKEISYIHAEGYPAGELKHGPLALVDQNMPVVAIAPHDDVLEKLKSNLQEVQARGGKLFVFTDSMTQLKQNNADIHFIQMPAVHPILAPIIYTIPLQLLAYHVAVLKGTDVDQPRNLAKSVTVE